MNARDVAERARAAGRELATAETAAKNAALQHMADALQRRAPEIVEANQADVAAAEAAGEPPNMVKRLYFGSDKLEGRVRSLGKIAALPDPVGEVFWHETLDNGLDAARVRVPLGVILMIYEARPHVSINAGAFCLKSGNAAILKGGSEAVRCNELLGRLWQESVAAAGLPQDSIQMVSGSHEEIDELLQQTECIDLVIPRGGKGLIMAVAERSRIPVVKHFAGVCHVYIDDSADLDKAIEVVLDSKCLMPAVCNALETVLVSASAPGAVERLCEALARCGVTVRGCERTRALVLGVEAATEEDWETEYLDMVLSVRVVDGVDAAVEHINTHGSHHTDSIVTGDESSAQRFRERVDSAVVLVNASTMFCDGETLGMGAEIGISTDKLHARGPMGLRELTSYKFVISGNGHVMGNPQEFYVR